MPDTETPNIFTIRHQESNVGAKNVELTEAKDELQKGLQVGVRAANHFLATLAADYSPLC